MTGTFFDRAYGTTAQNEVETLYEDWARTYDDDVTSNGYATPARCAAGLAQVMADKTGAILDFACGTGLSGLALANEGFTTLDGVDLSDAMLQTARSRGLYRRLIKAEQDAAPPGKAGDYAAIAAIGALSPGAAPAHFFDALLDRLAPGGYLAFSYNDHTLEVADYTDRLRDALQSGRAALRYEERGTHIAALGSQSVVYVLERQ